MRRIPTLHIFLLIFLVIAVPILYIQYSQHIAQNTLTSILDTMTSTLHEPNNTHILGGFSIDTPEEATKATTDDVQVVFKYGQPPSQNDKLGQQLHSLQMKVVDGYIWSLLFNYECHRTKTVKPPPHNYDSYCSTDTHPEMSSESVLLQDVAAHLKQVKDNQLIIGYWVLDDWVPWDAGSARQILIKIHNLIQQYTPDRPAICGFGGSLTSSHTSGWNDSVTDNFSPQGCNRVGLYIYAPTIYASTISSTTPTPSADSYDWSMSNVLPAMFASLQQRGWNITKEPLIGIGQAFGGSAAYSGGYWVTPTAKDIETQSKSFCEHGATGLVFYAWNDSEFGPTTQTPMNSTEIETGIRNSIAACKQYWNDRS